MLTVEIVEVSRPETLMDAVEVTSEVMLDVSAVGIASIIIEDFRDDAVAGSILLPIFCVGPDIIG
jgi:hypothetical protein